MRAVQMIELIREAAVDLYAVPEGQMRFQCQSGKKFESGLSVCLKELKGSLVFEVKVLCEAVHVDRHCVVICLESEREQQK